jgi:hypothetical protein
VFAADKVAVYTPKVRVVPAGIDAAKLRVRVLVPLTQTVAVVPVGTPTPETVICGVVIERPEGAVVRTTVVLLVVAVVVTAVKPAVPVVTEVVVFSTR